jgi:hypothetical protein
MSKSKVTYKNFSKAPVTDERQLCYGITFSALFVIIQVSKHQEK